MRLLLIWLVACLVTPSLAQTNSDGPTDEKAKKTYKEAIGYLNQRRPDLALDSFKKADKQDGGHCLDCQKKIIKNRKSTRLNSSHQIISYAVFCLKKKKKYN